MCGCDKSQSKASVWKHVNLDGKTTTYTNEADARMAKAKLGGRLKKVAA